LRWVLIRDPEGRFKPQALLCTDPTGSAHQIVEWFVWRWQLEVTFHEARTHLGVETQRQWSDRAIARTTPALLTRQAAWDAKPLPTFADTLAVIRQHLWPVALSNTSSPNTDVVQIPRVLLERFTDTLAFVA
jgi:hypothetical protein